MSISGYTGQKPFYDASFLNVGGRMYICSDAIFYKNNVSEYCYTTPTLKFITNTQMHGWGFYLLDSGRYEIIGNDSNIKLYYI